MYFRKGRALTTRQASRESLLAAHPVRCEPASAVVFEVDGKVYALNGMAMGQDRWADVDEIWADQPFEDLGISEAEAADIGMEPLKKSMVLIDDGLELC